MPELVGLAILGIQQTRRHFSFLSKQVLFLLTGCRNSGESVACRGEGFDKKYVHMSIYIHTCVHTSRHIHYMHTYMYIYVYLVRMCICTPLHNAYVYIYIYEYN